MNTNTSIISKKALDNFYAIQQKSEQLIYWRKADGPPQKDGINK